MQKDNNISKKYFCQMKNKLKKEEQKNSEIIMQILLKQLGYAKTMQSMNRHLNGKKILVQTDSMQIENQSQKQIQNGDNSVEDVYLAELKNYFQSNDQVKNKQRRDVERSLQYYFGKKSRIYFPKYIIHRIKCDPPFKLIAVSKGDSPHNVGFIDRTLYIHTVLSNTFSRKKYAQQILSMEWVSKDYFIVIYNIGILIVNQYVHNLFVQERLKWAQIEWIKNEQYYEKSLSNFCQIVVQNINKTIFIVVLQLYKNMQSTKRFQFIERQRIHFYTDISFTSIYVYHSANSIQKSHVFGYANKMLYKIDLQLQKQGQIQLKGSVIKVQKSQHFLIALMTNYNNQQQNTSYFFCFINPSTECINTYFINDCLPTNLNIYQRKNYIKTFCYYNKHYLVFLRNKRLQYFNITTRKIVKVDVVETDNIIDVLDQSIIVVVRGRFIQLISCKYEQLRETQFDIVPKFVKMPQFAPRMREGLRLLVQYNPHNNRDLIQNQFF